MKKLISYLTIVILIIGLTVVLCACHTGKTYVAEAESKTLADNFEIVSEDYSIDFGNMYIVYDKTTKVMYVIMGNCYAYRASITIQPLYNADGTLRIYGKE